MLIPLTQGRVALVDDEDYPMLMKYSWYWDGTYARSRIKGQAVRMHRLIMQVPPGLYIDHINGNGIDNRKANLRVATVSQNTANSKPRNGTSSKYKGVAYHKKSGKWEAYVQVNGQRLYLGLYDTEQEAARAYNAAARTSYGEYARLNVLED